MNATFKLTMILLIISRGAFGATAIKISPDPLVSAKCPIIGTYYSVVPVGSTLPSGCTYTWTVSGGIFSNQVNTGIQVIVIWNDSPGKGTLTVTTSNCSSGSENGNSATAKYTRISVAGMSWPSPSAYPTSYNVPLCNPPSYVQLMVDQLYVKNTGGIAEPPQIAVDAYGWSIPAGWMEYATNKQGPTTIYTQTRSIKLVPTGTSGGVVSVSGTVTATCGGTLPSPNKTITLVRTPSINLNGPPGFSSVRCGITNPLTFTVTSLPCATGYSWTKPSGWTGTSTSNSITVTPNGQNGGNISVAITIPSGTINKTYAITFINTAPPNPTLSKNMSYYEMCSGDGWVYTAHPPAGYPIDYGFEWYVQGAALLIQNQATSQSSPLVTSGNQVYVSCPGQAYGSAFIRVRLAKEGCTPSNYGNSETRAGVYNSNEFSANGPSQICPNTAADFVASYIAPDVLDYKWTAPNGWSYSGQGTPYFHVSVPPYFSGEAITLRLKNRCGYTNTPFVKYLFPGYGCGFSYYINQNPVSDVLIVTNVDPAKEVSAVLLNDENKPVTASVKSKSGSAQLDTSQVEEGVYYLEVSSAGSSERQRIVVKR